MLPAAHRMRRSPDFDTAVRRGRRAGRRTLVVHLAAPATPCPTSGPGGDQAGDAELGVVDGRESPMPARIGFVVSRAVGSSVVRSRVKRRLRAVTAARVDQLPPGSLVVVRANAASAGASSAELAADLDGALRRVIRQLDGERDGRGRRVTAGGEAE